MDIVTPYLIAGFLIGLSQATEVMGFFLRSAGQKHGMAGLGYSLHVQVATLARFGTFMGLPILGFAVDNGAGPSAILGAGIVSSTVTLSFCLLALRAPSVPVRLAQALFLRRARTLAGGGAVAGMSATDKPAALYRQSDRRRILIFGAVAFVATSIGVYITLMLGSMCMNYRATILQLTPAITALGAIFSVIYFDPRVSSCIDAAEDADRIVVDVIRSRVFGVCLALAAIVSVYFLAPLFVALTEVCVQKIDRI